MEVKFIKFKNNLLDINKFKARIQTNVSKVWNDYKISQTIPASVSIDNYRTFIYNQGNLGSCTANAFCGAYRVMCIIQKKNTSFIPSRLFFYYKERLVENDVAHDSGADIIDGLKYTKYYGVCSELLWPYVESKFAIKPPVTCDINALQNKIVNYSIIKIDKNLLNNIKQLINNKSPVMIAILVYTSFFSNDTIYKGIVTIPNKKTEQLLGGHEMYLTGYNDNTKLFICVNSWGKSWGNNGICYIPYDYLTDPDLGLEFTTFII